MDRVMEGLTALAEFLADRYKEDPGSKHLQSIKRAEIELDRLKAENERLKAINENNCQTTNTYVFTVAELVDRIAELEASEKRMREALEGLLDCPAIADVDFNDPEYGCCESAKAESRARAALAKEGE